MLCTVLLLLPLLFLRKGRGVPQHWGKYSQAVHAAPRSSHREQVPDLHELVVQGSVWGFASSVEELVQPLAFAVVHAVGAHHVELLHREILLHGTQRLNLASDADEEKLLNLQGNPSWPLYTRKGSDRGALVANEASMYARSVVRQISYVLSVHSVLGSIA